MTLGVIRIERGDYVPCRVAEWRVVFSEPAVEVLLGDRSMAATKAPYEY
ncbi:hypothetical protein [Synechococcus sp. UW179A]|nr:hypothetical protein [Synechococcus sp. UW179A]